MNIDGIITSSPSKYTIQIDKNQHLDIPYGIDKIENKHYWAALNHSCNPNSFIHNQQLIALQDIVAESDLTYNYNTTEYNLNSPFSCNCNQDNCFKKIKGFKFLTPEQKQFIFDQTISHLL